MLIAIAKLKFKMEEPAERSKDLESSGTLTLSTESLSDSEGDSCLHHLYSCFSFVNMNEDNTHRLRTKNSSSGSGSGKNLMLALHSRSSPQADLLSYASSSGVRLPRSVSSSRMHFFKSSEF